MKKLSIIRGKDVATCPYGLSIISACKDVGSIVLQMQVTEADKNKSEDIKKRNKVIYLTQKTNERCQFANEVMEKFDKVDCSYGDVAAGEGTYYLPSSPLYPRVFVGDGVSPSSIDKGQVVNDPRLYFDAPEKGIDVPFGLFSIFSSRSNELGLLKIADKYTNKIINIRDKLALLRDNYFDVLKLIIPNSSITKLSDVELETLLIVINDWAQ